jgi:peptidoglycan/xylan/chitin deacetylase (PgdA/CDA1 family)
MGHAASFLIGTVAAMGIVRRPGDGPAARPVTLTERLVAKPGFGRRFALFADAEEEFDWARPFDRAATATGTIAALASATARFNSAGLKPVYLCDYPVVDNPESAGIIRELVSTGVADVGTQLHPWVNPPFDEVVNAHNSYTGNLPLELQRAKLAALTDRIADATGVRPTVYRAGRYGLGPQTMRLLADAGYRMDVSVRSHFDYRDQGGPDYSDYPLWPWRTPEGPVELPLTSAWTGALRAIPALHDAPWMRGTLARSRMLQRVPLTPEGVPLADAIDAIRVLFDEGLEVFSLSFHTPSLVPGHTPYVRTPEDLDAFWRWWDGVFEEFARLGVTPTSCADLLDAFADDA